MHLHRLLLLTLLQLLSCCWAAQTRQLLSCPTNYKSLVEQLPEADGDSLLLTGPGVQLSVVSSSPGIVLVVESNRVLVNKSVADLMQQQMPYSGPHVMLCSDPHQSMAVFSIYIKVAKDIAEPDNDATTSSASPSTTVRHVYTAASAPPSSPAPVTAHGPASTRVTAHPPPRPATDNWLLALTIATCLLFALCIGLSAALAVAVRRNQSCSRSHVLFSKNRPDLPLLGVGYRNCPNVTIV